MATSIAPAPIRHILVGTDLSPASEAALAAAASLSRCFGATVDLLHVVEDYGVSGSAALPPLLAERLRAEAEAGLRKLVAGQPFQLRHIDARFGKPVEALLAAAAEWQADLLVVGTHGRTGLEHLALGSVAESLASTAPIDVLLVRSPNAGPWRRLLVALNATQPALRAAARAVQMARTCGPERLDAVTAFQLPLGWTELPGTYEAHFSRFRVIAEEEVAAGRQVLAAAGVPGEREIVEGDARRVLLQAVARHQSDLVFAGAHNRSRLASWLLGDTARVLAHRLPCSIWFTRGELERAPLRAALAEEVGLGR